ncbi:MAG TPA: hypothetical protein VNG13_03480 [Mycobacteriales bacterium]|nr:hypothetical protein [Mycobacteriales bacterium]
MARIQLRDCAATRAGDKGDTSNVAIFGYDEETYTALVAGLTAERVAAFLGDLVLGSVTRYEAPNVLALNFVMTRALGGGGPRSLRSDALGKTLGGALLRMDIDVPDAVAARAHRRRPDVTALEAAARDG